MTKWDIYIKAITSAIDRTDYLYEGWAKVRGQNSYVSRIMYIVYASEVTRQKDIVENYGMPKQTVNSVITKLLKNKYIILLPDKEDKRNKIIKLTESGRKYAEIIVTPLLDCEKKVLMEMGEEKVKLMIDTMNQYASLLERFMNESRNKKDGFK